MKKYLFIALFAALSTTTFAQSVGDMQYEMVSYSNGNDNTMDRASTRLFNLALFNQPYYVINYQNFSLGFQSLFDFIIGVSIATAIIVFMVAAFQQVINGGDVKAIKQGKEGMQRAIIGLIIILSTWLIINTINPDLLRLPMFAGLDSLKTSATTRPSPSVTGAGFP